MKNEQIPPGAMTDDFDFPEDKVSTFACSICQQIVSDKMQARAICPIHGRFKEIPERKKK
jgi:hypothetical protein